MKGEYQGTLVCRPRFTEQSEEQELEKGKSGNEPDPSKKKEGHLRQLQDNVIIPGIATIDLMVEFREFPWTQDAMLTVGRRDQLLMGYLAKNSLIEGALLKQWQDDQELHHRAMLSLAVYEIFTPEEERIWMDEYIKQREAE